MKRVMCVMLVVLIALGGCYDVEIHKLTGQPVSDKLPEVTKQIGGPIKAIEIPGRRGWLEDWDMITKLRWRIEALEKRVSEIEITPRPDKALLVKMVELGDEIDLQRAELRVSIAELKKVVAEAKIIPEQYEALLVRIVELEAALESQRAELRASIAELKKALSEAKIIPEQYEALLVGIADIEAALELQRAEERAEKLLLVKIADLEACASVSVTEGRGEGREGFAGQSS